MREEEEKNKAVTQEIKETSTKIGHFGGIEDITSYRCSKSGVLDPSELKSEQ